MSDVMKLQELEQAAAARLGPEFLVGEASADVSEYRQPLSGGREIDLTAASKVIEEGMRRFPAKDRAKSDRWLGPRLHAALRLTRREASRLGIWRFLGVCAFPEYVRWRFIGDAEDPAVSAVLERFVGRDYKHALGRLWWMAEMFRDGPDYALATRALSNQDVINNLFKNDTAHHRPTALGAILVLAPGGGESTRTGREANALAKAINATATTVMLDSYAPDEPLDDEARSRWIAEARDYDATLYFDELPSGPDDPPVPPASVERMKEMLKVLLEEAPVRDKKKPPIEAEI
jgi:hypothetical protein